MIANRDGGGVSSTARTVRVRAADAAGSEAASLVESAMLLRWRAPELALLLADRAVSAAQDDKMAVLRAEHLAVFTLNRLGRHAEAVHRLVPAIQDRETPLALRHELHVELAHGAVALGEPGIALGAIHPVLAAGEDVVPALRSCALVAVAEACSALACDELVTSALGEADELCREDPSLDHDTALLLRAAVQATDAARHRACGAIDRAESAIHQGRELLAGLADPEHDSGELSARLMLELVLLLLDRGAGEVALNEARPLLRRPARAATAAAGGRLRLALATRVHLAEGRHDSALTLLADAVEGAQRYGMDAVLAECLEGLSHVHEARDEFADALHCVRAARAAEARHRHEEAAAGSFLREYYGSARRDEERLVNRVAELLGNAGTGNAGFDADAEVESVEIMLDSPEPPSSVERPRAEQAVMSDAAEVESAVESWRSRARHRRGEAGTPVAVSDLLPTPATPVGRAGRRRAEELAEDQMGEVPVMEPRVLAPSGSAAPTDGAADDEAASSPPPAPAPPTLDWMPDDEGAMPNEGAAPTEDTDQMGIGDLLAEALVAYQQSRKSQRDKTTDEADISVNAPGRRRPDASWTASLALALAPGDEAAASDSDPCETSHVEPVEASTGPLLRLPTITAEPQWARSDAERRPAAGG